MAATVGSQRFGGGAGRLGALVALGLALLVVAAVIAYLWWQEAQRSSELLEAGRYARLAARAGNLLADGSFVDLHLAREITAAWALSGTSPGPGVLGPGSSATSNTVLARPGDTFHYGLYAYTAGSEAGPSEGFARFLWLDKGLNVLSWNDSSVWRVESTFNRAGEPLSALRWGSSVAPAGAAALRLVVWNSGDSDLMVRGVSVWQDGARVEPHPNGAAASLAFSFDWETAMGGPVHSKGKTSHDPEAAEREGLAMREGADWLRTLFAQHKIRATFYSTGYNLLDGNTERRAFSGNPTYRWASPEYGWNIRFWLTNPWFIDDPYGTYETDPAWYFGDQTRALLGDGHEIAPHTFGHLYVRGATPEELATDLDEWLKAAQRVGITQTTSFAFPWRSSNSLGPEYYDVMYERGITAVTRVYEETINDFFTLGAAPVSSRGVVTTYNKIALVPDFLLDPSPARVREAEGSATLGEAGGLSVLQALLERRGTTSFWTHPEQLASDAALSEARAAWIAVVEAAARERARGRLWIAPVREILAYQSAIARVTAALERGGDSWRLVVRNDSGEAIQGATVTLPGEVARIAPASGVRSASTSNDGSVTMSQAGRPGYPTRQLVFEALPPGETTLALTWTTGHEPPR